MQSLTISHPIKQDTKARILSILTHAIVLSMVFVLPEIVFTAFDRRPNPMIMYIHTITYIIVFYINYFVLIDRFLFKKKTFTYIIFALLLAIVMVFVMTVVHILLAKYVWHAPRHQMEMDTDHSKMILFLLGFTSKDFAMTILTIGLSVALKLSLRWNNIQQMNDKIVAEQRETELRNLKSQLNPHFLFNTLNNIYALIAIDSEKAQQSVHELSKLLRYTLYENEEKEVSLDKELLFVKSYIELMKLRLDANTRLTVDVSADDAKHCHIAPLMFISLIENAFKHGTSGRQKSEIDISISEKNGILKCLVTNSYFPKNRDDKSGSGIGITNLQRQLSLLYEGRYTYDAHVEDGKYIAELTINLNKTKTNNGDND